MDLLIPCIVVACLVPLGAWASRRQRKLLDQAFDQWGDENMLTVVSREQRFLRCGPFTWTRPSGICFKIVVETWRGEKRTGWILLRSSPPDGKPYADRDVAWDNQAVVCPRTIVGTMN